jgi:glycosyltransferase involved in cell wall biosynthesis
MAEQKLNIVMFGHKRIPSREGGIEIVVEELATRMVERGHHVTVLNRRGKHVSGGEVERVNEYKGVHVKTVATIDKKGLAAMTSSFTAAVKAAVSKADVVHIHAEGPAAMCWIPKLAGKRVICTIHGLDWARAKWGGFATKYIKWGEKQAVKHADEIIVLSRGVQEYFKTTYNRDTVFIPNGVSRPEPRSVNEIKKLWGLEKDSYVLFLGRIVPEKGLRYLVEAWKDIKTNKKLVIAGGSSDTETFMNELREMSPENVVFTGFQQGMVLEELYSNAYIYCLPSDLEGMPLSLLEAMSYGNCCLVSDIPECAEVVEDKAAVFPKGNVDELRRVLQQLLDDPETVEKYKVGAADFICQKYNWDDVVEKTLEIYKI